MKRVFNLKKGVASLIHEASRTALPLVVFFLVLVDLPTAAFITVLIFKWRVLAVKSRFWTANLRANTVDIMIGLSAVEYMRSNGLAIQLAWFASYVSWVLYIKKRSSQQGMIVQGVIAYAVAMSALVRNFDSLEHGVLLAGAWFIAYFSSRHILSSFKETHAPALAHVWALFVTQLTWVLWHWQVTYWSVSQLVLITTIALIGFSISYAMSKQENVNSAAIKQVLLSSSLMMLAIVLIHNWRETNF